MNKRTAVIFLGVLFLFSIKNSFAKGLGGANTSAWELISESNGIKVLERWVTNDKNLKVKERTGKMTLHCSVDEVLELISDAKRTHLWMSNVEKVNVLKQVDENEWYVHTILDAPWPFSKQDMVSKYRIIENSDHTYARVIIEKEDKLLPPQNDIDRLDTFNAEWIIEQVKEGKVKVTFTTLSTKPPKYPSWAQDPVVRKVFSDNLKNFKAVVNKA